MTGEAGQLPDEARALYGLAPGEFTSARNALARRLKKDGRADEAALVAKLRRPSRSAWALDQLARLEPAVVAEVLRTGKRLGDAMSAAEGRAAIDAAQADERRAVSHAVARAAELLADAGVGGGDAAAVQMAETLRAAILDPEVQTRLVTGTLDSDVSAPGFGGWATGAQEEDVGTDAEPGSGAPATAAAAQERRRRQAMRQRREREARQARARADSAAARADTAERQAQELRRRAEELAAAADGAERAVREADDG
jgi:hypothetical protein